MGHSHAPITYDDIGMSDDEEEMIEPLKGQESFAIDIEDSNMSDSATANL